jgi:uncharacterized protein with ATP-grasp and redox domains
MSFPRRPELPIPPPLRGSEYDSFAYHTIVERLPRIGRRVLATNAFAPAVSERLEMFLAEIPAAKIRLLQDPAPDAEAWMEYVRPHLDDDWLEVPWFFAEVYFYRRILEATGYFADGPRHRVDPFAAQKRESLLADWKRVQRLAGQLAAQRRAGWDAEALAEYLSIALWGNQGDLSMWPSGVAAQPTPKSGERDDYLLADDRPAVRAFLATCKPETTRVDFLMDNVGFELVSDLALVDYLLESQTVASVHLHLKSHPLFVSDALIADVEETVARLATAGNQDVVTFGRRLQGHLEEQRLQMHQHSFWSSPLAGWEMPEDLHRTLGNATLVISKGDANYRRLLGDGHWAFTAPFSRIVSYFSAPLLALRTLKSEVAAGIAPQTVAALTARDVSWLTSGQWGVIQFAPASAEAEG